tara:strand:+ start:745 stop:900 length:156 start_codon:yes stop_codon:yes gene_type:complete
MGAMGAYHRRIALGAGSRGCGHPDWQYIVPNLADLFKHALGDKLQRVSDPL